jgi:hypothetical protein
MKVNQMFNTVVPDLRDRRGTIAPDRHQLQGNPRTENEHPAGGMISTDRYRHKGPSAQTPENASTPFSPGDGRGIRTEK